MDVNVRPQRAWFPGQPLAARASTRAARTLLCARAVKHRLLVLLTVAACGGDGSDGEPITLDMLPEAARQQFVAWKAKPIKDCAWQQAFPSLATQADGPSYTPSDRVDYAALLAANEGSALFAGDGQLALIGPGAPDSLFRDYHYTTNGGLDVRSTLEGGVCVVTLGGEELFRADLPAAVPVYASYQSGKLGATGSDLGLMRTGTLDNQDIGAVDSTPLVRHALGALAPNHDIDGFLAARLSISTATAAALFLPLSSSARSPDAVRIVARPELTPFFPGQQIYGPVESLLPLYDGTASQIELLFRVPDDASALIALRADLASTVGGKAIKATAITAAPAVATSDAAFLACFAQRRQAVAFDSSAVRTPAFEEQFFGCEGLTVDGMAALADDATQRAEVVRQALTSNFGPYRGWDNALITVAQRLDARGVELSVLGSDPLLAPILAHWGALRTAITDGDVRARFAPSIIELVFRWFFLAEEPTDAFVASIHTALANAAPRFAGSASSMLLDLAFDVEPTGDGGRAVTCGVELAGERSTAVDRALAAVAAVPYSDDFLDRLRASFLQDCPSSATLGTLEPASTVVSAFIKAEAAKNNSSIVFDDAARRVVDRALTERWTTDTFAAVTDVVALGSASTFLQCRNSATVSVQAICIDSSLDTFSSASGKMLAPATAARYAELARALAARWDSISPAIDVQFDIADAFFAGMWLGCSDAGFARSRDQLFDLLDRLKGATLDRFEIADQIGGLVTSSTCS